MLYGRETELMNIANTLVGKSLLDIGYAKQNDKLKLAKNVEIDYFNKYRRNKHEEEGVLLRLVPYYEKGGHIFVKENVPLDTIDNFADLDCDFETSDFRKNNSRIVMVFFSIDNTNYSNSIITHVYYFEYPKKDIAIIKHDFKIIVDYTKRGIAEKLTIFDTMYLIAMPLNRKRTKEQPNSSELVHRRAYALRNHYVTAVFKSKVLDISSSNEVLIHDPKILDNVTVQKYIYDKMLPLYGRQKDHVAILIGVKYTAKNTYDLILRKILKLNNSNLSVTSEFKKAGIIHKPIKYMENPTDTESLMLYQFTYEELYNLDWDNSHFKEMLYSTSFYFTIYDYIEKYDELILINSLFHHIPLKKVERHLRRLYEDTRKKIIQGKIIKAVQRDKLITNFMKQKDNKVGHVKSNATSSSDTYTLPVPDVLTKKTELPKQAFWLNGTYIYEIIDDLINNRQNSVDEIVDNIKLSK